MAARKKLNAVEEGLQVSDTFEGDLDFALNSLFKQAPEFKEILAEDLKILKHQLLSAHERHLEKASEGQVQKLEEQAQKLEENAKLISVMNDDLNVLKTTLIRMVVTQYNV